MEQTKLTSEAAPQRKGPRWGIGRREIIAMVVGTLLYAGIPWLTNFMRLADTLGVDLRPGIAVPIVLGFVYGPVVGLVVGFAGNTLGDLASFQAWYWNWSLGNGIMGLIPGLFALRWRSYRTLGDHVRAFAVTVLGIVLGMGAAAFLDVWVCREGAAAAACFTVPVTLNFALTQEFIPVVRVNIITALILVPLLLFNIERLDLRATDWFGSGLLRRLLLAIMVSAALPVALLGFFLLQQFSGQATDSANLTLRLVFTIAVSLVFTIANALLVAQSISRPLLRLTRAAGLMEAGKLTDEEAGQLKATGGDDEIAQLSKMFGQMAEEVIIREEALRRQVEELRIEIDEAKRQKQVNEIVESDFFQDLQARARTMRTRKARIKPDEPTDES